MVGQITVQDFPLSKDIAGGNMRLTAGGCRELHWHNAGEWAIMLSGSARITALDNDGKGSITSKARGRMTVFFNGSKARTADFNAGDVGLVPRTLGHYIENTGDQDLIFLEMFRADRFMDLSLSQWVTNSPPELIKGNLGIGDAVLQAIPKTKAVIMPI